jgi:hypothetical protein
MGLVVGGGNGCGHKNALVVMDTRRALGLFWNGGLWVVSARFSKESQNTSLSNGISHAAPSRPGSQISGCALSVRDLRVNSESEWRRDLYSD